MATSVYYYNEYIKYKREYEKYAKLVTLHSKYNQKLATLLTYLIPTYSNLIASESKFKNGGWVYGGDVFQQASLKEAYGITNDVILELRDLIITGNYSLTTYQNNYDDSLRKASENYQLYEQTLAEELAAYSEGDEE